MSVLNGNVKGVIEKEELRGSVEESEREGECRIEWESEF